jgi:hypothetical protein
MREVNRLTASIRRDLVAATESPRFQQLLYRTVIDTSQTTDSDLYLTRAPQMPNGFLIWRPQLGPHQLEERPRLQRSGETHLVPFVNSRLP